MYINATKNKQGNKYRYSDLLTVVQAVDEAGYEFQQTVEQNSDGAWCVKTRTRAKGDDKYGDWTASIPIITTETLSREGKRTLSNAQEFGSALTYARRYSLYVACNVIPDDDDGASAGIQTYHPKTNGVMRRSPGISQEDVDNLKRLSREHGYDLRETVRQAIGHDIESPDMLTSREYAQVIKLMQGNHNG